MARLKSTLGQPNNNMPDFISNALAAGMDTAEKSMLKSSEARLARMQKALNLTADQVQAISDIMTNYAHQQSQMALDIVGGKMTAEKQATMTREVGSQDAGIKALLTPEQFAAYPDFQQSERAFSAETAAKSEASVIAGDFNLSPDQQEQIHAALYQMSLNDTTAAPQQASISAAARSGNLADAAKMMTDLRTAQLEEKLKVLANYLTPEQISTYREKEMSRINQSESALKIFQRTNPSGTSN